MSSSPYPRLLGDVGGTNARFAWAAAPDAALSDIAQYPCAEHPSLHAAIGHYLQQHQRPAPRACAIGIANPITGDRVQMTNHHWSFSISELRRELAVARLAVVNDFTALALSLPALDRADLHAIGGGRAVQGEPLAVIGPGTGLGVSGLLPSACGASPVAVAGEGGHATLAPNDDEEAAVLALLRERFGHVSAERALSGPGLVNLYTAAAQLAQQMAEPLSPAEVITRAREHGDALCRSAIDLFCRFLGSAAGNLALTFGARGGVFIGAGIVPRLLPELAASRFRERFEGKGRFQDYLADIPTFVIAAAVSPALIGASRALEMDKFCSVA